MSTEPLICGEVSECSRGELCVNGICDPSAGIVAGGVVAPSLAGSSRAAMDGAPVISSPSATATAGTAPARRVNPLRESPEEEALDVEVESAPDVEVATAVTADGVFVPEAPGPETRGSPPDMPSVAFSEEEVLMAIEADKRTLSEEELEYATYASLHTLEPAYWDTARVALSKALNSTARGAPVIVNPICTDPTCVVYRFDVRDYWSWRMPITDAGRASNEASLTETQMNESFALEAWQRVNQGNIDLSKDDNLGGEAPEFPNIRGFHPEYAEVAQVVYSLSRPDIYGALMMTPFSATLLEANLAVNYLSGVAEYEFTLVEDSANLFGQRLIWRADALNGAYYKTADVFITEDFSFFDYPIPEFVGDDFSQYKSRPVNAAGVPREARGDDQQAAMSAVIYDLPNGLHGYAVYGAGNQAKDGMFRFVMADATRNPEEDQESSQFGTGGFNRLIVGESCFRCHEQGLVAAVDSMRPYVESNTDLFEKETLRLAYDLYATPAARLERFNQDNARYQAAMGLIYDGMQPATAPLGEPISIVSDWALELYGYIRSITN